MMLPGEDSSVSVKMLRPMIREQGDRFTIRDRSNTIATGVVTKVLPDVTPEEKVQFEKGKTRKGKDEMVKRLAEIEEAFKDQA
jgi:elongation factor Tu